MNHLLLTHDVLNISDINDLVTADSCGAISLFVGTTRDNFEEKRVISLEYEAYEPMALKQITAICDDLRCRWPDIVNIAIYHRLGMVPVREASVVIAISSPHRNTSLDAVASAIEELKKRVPIWKKEKYDRDESAWKENKECESVGVKSISFDERICDINDPNPVPTQLVQISAAEDEISRRIQCFVEKKREEIDFNNIMDFTDIKRRRSHFDESGSSSETAVEPEEQNDDIDDGSKTCARINSIIIKQEYSKAHLKVRRVENNIGPQMRPDYLNTLDKLMIPHERTDVFTNFNVKTEKSAKPGNKDYTKGHPAFFERLENIEEHLNLPNNKIKNIYQRLKAIEDRVLYLESISPEYRHFLFEKTQIKDTNTFQESSKDIKHGMFGLSYDRKMYSIDEIDTIIQHIEGREAEFTGGNEE